MPVLSITKTYLNGNILTETDLDNIRSSITTFFNTTGIDSTNIQTGGVTGTNIANGTITAANIAAGTINTAQLASSAVTTANIGPLAVTSAQIASSAVGSIQRAPLNYISSTGSGSQSSTSTSFVDMTNLTATITTTGRQVLLSMQSDGTLQSNLQVSGAATACSGDLQLLRDSTRIGSYKVAMTLSGGSPYGNILNVHGAFTHVDNPVAGTYVYKMQFEAGTGTTISQVGYKLLAFEL